MEELLQRSRRARDDLLKRLGSIEPLTLSQPASPSFAERPKWPALRQSFKLVRRPQDTVLLVSDGLSDPFDDVTLGASGLDHLLYGLGSSGGLRQLTKCRAMFASPSTPTLYSVGQRALALQLVPSLKYRLEST